MNKLARILPYLGAIGAIIAGYITYKDAGIKEAVTVGVAIVAFSVAAYYGITKKDIS